MRTIRTAVAVAAVAALTLTGCTGNTPAPTASTAPAATSTPTAEETPLTYEEAANATDAPADAAGVKEMTGNGDELFAFGDRVRDPETGIIVSVKSLGPQPVSSIAATDADEAYVFEATIEVPDGSPFNADAASVQVADAAGVAEVVVDGDNDWPIVPDFGTIEGGDSKTVTLAYAISDPSWVQFGIVPSFAPTTMYFTGENL